jgi:hypothetical protein
VRALVLLSAFVLLAFLGAATVQADATIVAWGDNSLGECTVPAPNAGFETVAGGYRHTLGLKSDGTIVAWGWNGNGQCNVPSPNAGFLALGVGYSHSLGIKTGGTIVAWGSNNFGQCTVPSPNSGFVAVTGGYDHTLGLKSGGTIVAWGSNSFGQCSVPSPNSGFVAVGASTFYSVGLKSDGTIVAWGYNGQGQCNVPAPDTGFVAIAVGRYHGVVLKSAGTIVTWGTTGGAIPSPNAGFTAVAAGGLHSMALRSNGTIVAWGNNGFGQCTIPSPNTCFVALAGGDSHSLGLQVMVMGACCAQTGTCTVTWQTNCPGTWTEAGLCVPNPCPPPGSCCAPDGACTVTLQASCAEISIWTEAGVCEPTSCPQPSGFCCVSDGTCTVTRSAACTGTWTAAGTCVPNLCPQPGSCCALDGTCIVTMQASCAATAIWTEAGICEPNPCAQPPNGSCCAQDASCTVTTQASCTETATWTEAGICEPNTCGPPSPIGSCCTPARICTVTIQANCSDTWTQAGVCTPNSCPSSNAGGVLWVHDTGIVFSTDLTLPPVSTPPADCAGVDTEQPVWNGVDPDAPLSRIWKVYAAFPAGSHPRLNTVGWAIQFPDAATSPLSYVNVTGGGIADEDGPGTDFFIGSLGFPTASGGQIGQSFPTGPRTTTVVTLFYFYGFGYSATGPLPTWSVVGNSNPFNRFFGDDAFPANVDPIMGYGSLGFGTPGSTPMCSAGACCHDDGACTYTIQANCGGPAIWQGEGTICNPNPCPDPAGVDSGLSDAQRLQVLAAPNPSAGGVVIRCLLPTRTPTTLVLFDASGRVVRRLHEGDLPAGETSFSWDGRSDAGQEVPGGAYFAKVTTLAGESSTKLVLTR